MITANRTTLTIKAKEEADKKRKQCKILKSKIKLLLLQHKTERVRIGIAASLLAKSSCEWITFATVSSRSLLDRGTLSISPRLEPNVQQTKQKCGHCLHYPLLVTVLIASAAFK